MSWGNKLVVVFVLFAVFIGTMVYKAFNTPLDLVSKDYYKEELRYQEKIDGMNNAAKISKVIIAQNQTAINIQFPIEQKGKSIKGEAFFYCVTDEKKDIRLPIIVDSTASLAVLKNKLQKGVYALKLNWQLDKEAYYNEQKLVVQ
ncbi:MAG: FixH family protein [Bacteroidetes bacterium]|nr:FixH family protein [Bacteroidota bacterium]